MLKRPADFEAGAEANLRSPPHRPRGTASSSTPVGGRRYWLKRDVDRWCREHRDLIARRRRRRNALTV